MSNTLGDGSIEDQYREKMIAIVRGIDEILNGQVGGPGRKTGFVLLVFPFGDHEGRCNYISNGADRRGIAIMLREQLARFEGMPSGEGRA